MGPWTILGILGYHDINNKFKIDDDDVVNQNIGYENSMQVGMITVWNRPLPTPWYMESTLNSSSGPIMVLVHSSDRFHKIKNYVKNKIFVPKSSKI